MARRAEYKHSFSVEDRIELLCRAIERLAGVVKDTLPTVGWQDDFKAIDDLLKLAKER